MKSCLNCTKSTRCFLRAEQGNDNPCEKWEYSAQMDLVNFGTAKNQFPNEPKY